MRTFIAIEIPGGIKQAMAAQTASLKTNSNRAVRWVTAENTHLTLKFLGEISQPNISLLSHMLQAECSQTAPFEIVVTGLGCFPNPRRPRVIWIGLQVSTELKNLQQKIEAAAERLGFAPEDKPFSPHLTIGRVREQASAEELMQLHASITAASVGTLGAFTVQEVCLFKSELQPAGPVYSHLFDARLGIQQEL